DDGARGAHLGHGGRGEAHRAMIERDLGHLLEGQARAAQDDRAARGSARLCRATRSRERLHESPPTWDRYFSGRGQAWKFRSMQTWTVSPSASRTPSLARTAWYSKATT